MPNNNRHEGMIGNFALNASGRPNNVNHPKHCTVTYLMLDELKTVAQNWKVDIKLD